MKESMGAEAGIREDSARCPDQCPVILLEARTRECIYMARRNPEQKQEPKRQGMKMPKSYICDPKPL